MNRWPCCAALAVLVLATACGKSGDDGEGDSRKLPPTAGEKLPSKSTSLHPRMGELPALLRGQVRQAERLGLKPFVYLWADWCPPCKAIDAARNDPAMIEAFRGVYLIKVDVDQWGDGLLGTPFEIDTIPTYMELSRDGTPTGREIDGDAWGEDKVENIATALKAFFHGS